MVKVFKIYFEDLVEEAQNELLEKFGTTFEDEINDCCPIAIIEREVDGE